jgi:hypothetical protein
MRETRNVYNILVGRPEEKKPQKKTQTYMGG